MSLLPWMVTVALAQQPLVIAHRGSPGYLPDHTLAGYERAIALGADYLEPDLVSTADGVLVARHENEIGGTTDVARHFPQRKTTKVVDGESISGWFTEDFTLAELKTLRARQPMDDRPKTHDGRYEIPTLDEILALVTRLEAEHGRRIGLYPETKHPSYFDQLGLSLEEPLVEALHAAGLDGPEDPVFIQSFEVGNLQQLAQMTGLRRVQLVWEPTAHPWDQRLGGKTYGDLLTPEGLAFVATYAHGLGVHKAHLLPPRSDGTLGPTTGLLTAAHHAGLLVHVYTFRSEDRYLPPEHKGDPQAELQRFFALGIDGAFCDFPDVGVRARPVTDGAAPASPVDPSATEK